MFIEVASGSGFPLLHQIAPALFKIPTFFVSNTGNAITYLHYCYVIVDRDPVAQKQEDAGSLANFCPSLESGFDIEEQKNRKRDIRGIIGHGIQLLLSDRWVIFYVLLQRLQLLRSEYLFYVILYIFKVLLYLLWLSWAKLIQCPKFERVTYSYHLIICS